jgi:peroxiredoxin
MIQGGVRLRRKAMKTFNRFFVRTVLAVALLFATSQLAQALQVGDKAPDFELDSTAGGKLKLSSLKGKNVLINVYVLDYSPT